MDLRLGCVQDVGRHREARRDDNQQGSSSLIEDSFLSIFLQREVEVRVFCRWRSVRLSRFHWSFPRVSSVLGIVGSPPCVSDVSVRVR